MSNRFVGFIAVAKVGSGAGFDKLSCVGIEPGTSYQEACKAALLLGVDPEAVERLSVVTERAEKRRIQNANKVLKGKRYRIHRGDGESVEVTWDELVILHTATGEAMEVLEHEILVKAYMPPDIGPILPLKEELYATVDEIFGIGKARHTARHPRSGRFVPKGDEPATTNSGQLPGDARRGKSGADTFAMTDNLFSEFEQARARKKQQGKQGRKFWAEGMQAAPDGPPTDNSTSLSNPYSESTAPV
jgi:hypothetical protein